jgi:hypothetical protein
VEVVIGIAPPKLDVVERDPGISSGPKVDRPEMVKKPPGESEPREPDECPESESDPVTGTAQVEWTTVGSPSVPMMV